jgi:predicted O-methyltransferase YrrM|tara:strand:- start:2845 stop:3564 length:720 start_codon:yes stop_codon:yes gene_type:complete
MAYHGYVHFISQFAGVFNAPSILEIGVDKGQSLFPIANNLSKVCTNSDKSFLYTGVDVLIRDHVEIASGLINQTNWNDASKIGLIQVFEENSLDVMPHLIKNNLRYSTILIDGDHNYATVSKELEYSLDLIHERGIIVCDDYDGKGGQQDEYFSNAPNFYRDEQITEPMTKLIKKEDDNSNNRTGVKDAVDEFLENNPEWAKYKFFTGEEPVVLYRKDRLEISTITHGKYKQINYKFLG